MNEVVQTLWRMFSRVIVLLLLTVVLANCTTNTVYQNRWRLVQLNKEAYQAYDTANYSAALKKWEQSLNLARQVGSQHNIGEYLNNIGKVYLRFDNYQKALGYYQQALAIYKKVDDKHGTWNNLANISLVYSLLGEYQKASDYNKQTLVAYEELVGKIKTFIPRYTHLSGTGNPLADIVMNVIAMYVLTKQMENRIEPALKNTLGLHFYNLGMFYFNMGYYPKALDYYQQVLVIHKELGNKRREGMDLTNIGEVYKNTGEYKKAKNAFQDSIAIGKSIGTDETWLALRGLASTEAKLNQSIPAIQHYIQAIYNLEKIRNLLTQEHKTSFMRQKIYVYDELITLLQSLHSVQPKKGYDRKAFETFERKQGRQFLEEMGQSGARRFGGVSEKITQKEESFVQQLAKLKAQLFEQRAKNALYQDSFNIERLTQQIATIKEEQAELETRIKSEYPKYHALKHPQPVNNATKPSLTKW